MAVRVFYPGRRCLRRQPYTRYEWDPFTVAPFQPRSVDALEELLLQSLPIFLTLAKRDEKKNNENHKNKEENTENEKTSPFTYDFDLKGFAPGDIKVKTVGQTLMVEARSEVESDQDGIVSHTRKEYHRSLVLPETVDAQQMTSTFGEGGVLKVTAPRLALKASEEQQVEVQVETTPAESKPKDKEATTSETPEPAHTDDERNS